MRKRRAPVGKIRLQKYLSDAGVASRRKAEELILDGRVLVNEEVVDTLPAFVDPGKDSVIANGDLVKPQRLAYYLLHKPTGVVCTNRDPGGRRRAVDYLPPMKERLNVVGRLDVDSSGLLLMTNDGELAMQVTHPRFGVPKTYRVEVKGHVDGEAVEKMEQGVYLAEGKASAKGVVIVHASRESSVLHITLKEGRNRQIRRMLARIGHRVKKLKRLNIGPLTIKGLPLGTCRPVTAKELHDLREAIAGRLVESPIRPRRGRRNASTAKPTRKTGKSTTATKRTTKRSPRKPREIEGVRDAQVVIDAKRRRKRTKKVEKTPTRRIIS